MRGYECPSTAKSINGFARVSASGPHTICLYCMLKMGGYDQGHYVQRDAVR